MSGLAELRYGCALLPAIGWESGSSSWRREELGGEVVGVESASDVLIDAMQVLRDHRGSGPGYTASEDKKVRTAFHA
jgi:hypothetical protein